MFFFLFNLAGGWMVVGGGVAIIKKYYRWLKEKHRNLWLEILDSGFFFFWFQKKTFCQSKFFFLKCHTLCTKTKNDCDNYNHSHLEEKKRQLFSCKIIIVIIFYFIFKWIKLSIIWQIEMLVSAIRKKWVREREGEGDGRMFFR